MADEQRTKEEKERRGKLKTIIKDANVFLKYTAGPNAEGKYVVLNNEARLRIMREDTNDELFEKARAALAPVANAEDFQENMEDTSPALLDFMMEECFEQGDDSEEEDDVVAPDEEPEPEMSEEEEQPDEEPEPEPEPEPDEELDEGNVDDAPEDVGTPTAEKVAMLSQPGLNTEQIVGVMEAGFANMIDAINSLHAAMAQSVEVAPDPSKRSRPKGTPKRSKGATGRKAEATKAPEKKSRAKKKRSVEPTTKKEAKELGTKKAQSWLRKNKDLKDRRAFSKAKRLNVRTDTLKGHGVIISGWFRTMEVMKAEVRRKSARKS